MTDMASPDYVWEKMLVAICAMCGRGSLETRLANATVSALMRLKEDDLGRGDLREDLRYILSWTKENLKGDTDVVKVPNDIELSRLIEKMLHILLETNDPT
jgi:hypothetical protein